MPKKRRRGAEAGDCAGRTSSIAAFRAIAHLAAAALRSSAFVAELPFAAAVPFFGRFGPFEAASGIAAAPKGRSR